METTPIREKRIEKGLTTKYVAEYLGIKRETLTRKERENSFTLHQLRLLKELYGVADVKEIA